MKHYILVCLIETICLGLSVRYNYFCNCDVHAKRHQKNITCEIYNDFIMFIVKKIIKSLRQLFRHNKIANKEGRF